MSPPQEEDNNSPPGLLKVSSSSSADDDNNVVVGTDQPSQPPTLDNNNNHHHDAALKRLEEVATTSYPFPIPERKSTKDLPKEERLNLTSKKNLRPLFVGMIRFLFKLSLPPLTLLFILLGYYFSSTATSTTSTTENNDESSIIHVIFYALAVICFAQIMLFDPFFVHWITNGMFGGLGRGGCDDASSSGGGASSTVKDGFTCQDNPRNNYIRSKIEHFATNYSPTPYLYSGDLLTLIPFLLFKGSKGGRVPYKRYWVKIPSAPAPDGNDGPKKRPTGTDQDEAVALDIVFPPNGYQPDKPTFLILHGLNGGSTEPYVLDLARKATREGHTVAVMINRGLMKTPVKGMDSFYGARTSDVGCAVDALLYAWGGQPRSAGSSSSGNNQGQQQPPIVLVGFSMGGIIAANYTAKSKDQSGLVGTISFSGTVCSEKMLLDTPSANHSIAIWQPPLAWGLKGTIVKPNMTNLVKRGVSKKLIEDEIKTVKDIDSTLVCLYHGYESIQHYYEDLSPAGRGDDEGLTRLKGVQVPLLVVHAMDDPIAIYEVTLADKISNTENVMLLSTKHGGHIGWPTGLFPSKNRWNFMIDIAMEYATTVVADDFKMTPSK